MDAVPNVAAVAPLALVWNGFVDDATEGPGAATNGFVEGVAPNGAGTLEDAGCVCAAAPTGTVPKTLLLTLLVEVYALLEVAVELKTLSNSARAAYLSDDIFD